MREICDLTLKNDLMTIVNIQINVGPAKTIRSLGIDALRVR